MYVGQKREKRTKAITNYESLLEKFRMFQEIKLTSRLYQIGDNYTGLFVISVNIGFNKIHLLSVHPLHYYGRKTPSVQFLGD